MITLILVLARTLHLGGAMLIVALPFFTWIVLRPALDDDSAEVFHSFHRRILKGLGFAWFVEAGSGFVWFWFVVAQMNDESPSEVLDVTDFSTVLAQTQFGQLWLLRGVLGLVLGVLLFVLARRKTVPSLKLPPLDGVLLVISVVLLVSLAWAGHGASGVRFSHLHLIADATHLLLGAIWPAGLIPLFYFLWQILEANQIITAKQQVAILERFSQISLLAVFILVATGIINSWLMLGSWVALLTTTYGELLLAQIPKKNNLLQISVAGAAQMYSLHIYRKIN